MVFKEAERPWENVIGLYPNIPHECLSCLRKHLDLRTEKEISIDTLVGLAKTVFKNNIFNFNVKTFR